MFQCVYSGKTKYSTSNYNKFHFGPMDGKISHEKWIRKPKICLRRRIQVSNSRTQCGNWRILMWIQFYTYVKSIFSKIWVSKTTIWQIRALTKNWNFQKIKLQSRSNRQNGNFWGKKCSNLISRNVLETDNSNFTLCHDHEKHPVPVWKFRTFTLTHFWQKFRESNVFTIEIAKELIWRNIFWWD